MNKQEKQDKARKAIADARKLLDGALDPQVPEPIRQHIRTVIADRLDEAAAALG